MVEKIEYTRPWLAPYQTDILDCPERFSICEASTKTGKTASHIVWLLEQALQGEANYNYWWIAPIYATAEIAYHRFKNQIDPEDEDTGETIRSFFRTNEGKLTLTLPNGAIIWFKGADKPDSLYGDDVHAVVFDEFTRAKEEAWFAIRSTLTATKGKCKFIGNCKGKKNWGHRMAMKAKAGAKDYRYFKITAYDAVSAGILSIEEIEQAKRDLPKLVFDELYLAEASEDGSNPFGYQFIKSCIKPLSKQSPVCFGIDLAKSVDYTVVIGLDRNGDVCFLQRWQSDWQQTKNRIIALPPLPMLIDSTGVGDPIVEELQKKNSRIEGYKFTAGSKQQLMEGLTVAIQNGEIGFPEGVIVDELEQFEFEYTRSGVRYTAPTGVHDDTVCALALAYQKFQSAKGKVIKMRSSTN